MRNKLNMKYIEEKEAYPCSHCGKGEYFIREDLREVDRRAREEEQEKLKELYEALGKMWEQYCPEPLTHLFMSAGENAEEMLDKYRYLENLTTKE